MRAFAFAISTVLLGAVPAAATPAELVDQFVASCIGTLPRFETLSATLEGTEFHQVSDHQWMRGADGAVFQFQEADDRFVCLAGLTGDYVAEFTSAITERLEANDLGRFEIRQFQGRTLYLLQAAGGMTILEVYPPLGATTFLAANARKE